MTTSADAAAARLVGDGLIASDGAGWRTTARWQAAMMRAASRLLAQGDPGDDLRVPVVVALLELYGDAVSEGELVALAAAILPIEAKSLAPKLGS